MNTMGLPHKNRRMKLRWPEYLGFALLAAFALIVAFTYSELDQMNWKRTTARVIGVNVKHDNRTVFSPIGSSNNGVTVLYQYDIGSRIVTSEWTSNWLNTPILNHAAPTLTNPATQLDVINSITNARKTEKAQIIPTFDETTAIADPRVGPPEVSRSLRGENFYGVLSERRKSLSAVAPQMISGDEVERILPKLMAPISDFGNVEAVTSVSPFMAEKPKLIQKATELKIRFDPRNPENSALDYPGFNLHLPTLILDVLLALLLVRYFARTYPNLKLQGY